jgi:hypothetical protein
VEYEKEHIRLQVLHSEYQLGNKNNKGYLIAGAKQIIRNPLTSMLFVVLAPGALSPAPCNWRLVACD